MYPGITLAGLMELIAAFGIIGGIVMLARAARLNTIERHVKQAVGTARA